MRVANATPARETGNQRYYRWASPRAASLARPLTPVHGERRTAAVAQGNRVLSEEYF